MAAVSGIILALVIIGVIVFFIASVWKIFTKAGQPGWACIVPFYNYYIMLQIAKKPSWWLVWFFIPVASLIVMIIIMINWAKLFGKSGGFAVGLILLPFIFLPILGFGDSQYNGAVAGDTNTAADMQFASK